jgi:hypothetical protein
MVRALPCCSLGNLSTAIEINIILSIPKIISNTVSVSKLISPFKDNKALKSLAQLCIVFIIKCKYNRFLSSILKNILLENQQLVFI